MNNKTHSLRELIQFISLGILIVSLISIFSDVHRYFELFSHFKFAYLFISVSCFITLLWMRFYKFSIVMCCVVIINSFYILPWYIPNHEDNQQTSITLKLLHSNVLTSNQNYQKFGEILQKELPDIIVLQEIDQVWIENLAGDLFMYPYRIERPQSDNFGIALYSKFPFKTSSIKRFGKRGMGSIEAVVSLGDKDITLLATHPLPPVNSRYYNARNDQLNEVASYLSTVSGAKILIGDLNTTMWSSNYNVLEESTGLTNARMGFGILPTWPARLPLIPIDHLLVSSHVIVKNIKVGDNFGSDHLPLIVQLSIKEY